MRAYLLFLLIIMMGRDSCPIGLRKKSTTFLGLDSFNMVVLASKAIHAAKGCICCDGLFQNTYVVECFSG